MMWCSMAGGPFRCIPMLKHSTKIHCPWWSLGWYWAASFLLMLHPCRVTSWNPFLAASKIRGQCPTDKNGPGVITPGQIGPKSLAEMTIFIMWGKPFYPRPLALGLSLFIDLTHFMCWGVGQHTSLSLDVQTAAHFYTCALHVPVCIYTALGFLF